MQPAPKTFESVLNPVDLALRQKGVSQVNPQYASPLCRLPVEILEKIYTQLTLSGSDSLRHTCKRLYGLLTNGREIERQYQLCSRRKRCEGYSIVNNTNYDSWVRHLIRKKIVLEHCAMRKSPWRVHANRYSYDISALRRISAYATAVFSRSGEFVAVYDASDYEYINSKNSSWFRTKAQKPNVYLFHVVEARLQLLGTLCHSTSIVYRVELSEGKHREHLFMTVYGDKSKSLYRINFTQSGSLFTISQKLQLVDTTPLPVFARLSPGHQDEDGGIESPKGDRDPNEIITVHTNPSDIVFFDDLGQGRIGQRPRTRRKTLRKWQIIETPQLAKLGGCTELSLEYALPRSGYGGEGQFPNLYIADYRRPEEPLVQLHFPRPGKATHVAFLGQIMIPNPNPTHSCEESSCLACYDDYPVYQIRTSDQKYEDHRSEVELHTRFVIALDAAHIFLFDIPQTVIDAAVDEFQIYYPRTIAYLPDLQSLVFNIPVNDESGEFGYDRPTVEKNELLELKKRPKLCAVTPKEFLIVDFNLGRTLPLLLYPHSSLTRYPISRYYKGEVNASGNATIELQPGWREDPQLREAERLTLKDRIEGFGVSYNKEAKWDAWYKGWR